MDEAIAILVKLVEKLREETWANEVAQKMVITGVLMSIDKLKASE